MIAEVKAREDAGCSAQCWNCITKSTNRGESARCFVRSSRVCLGTLYGSNTSLMSDMTVEGLVAMSSCVSSLWALYEALLLLAEYA